ncbi:MAG: tetratricopeptide repeat protein [Planctomycetota bacterium]
MALARLGRTDEAIAEYRKALEIDPNHASARRALGETLGRHTQRQDP